MKIMRTDSMFFRCLRPALKVTMHMNVKRSFCSTSLIKERYHVDQIEIDERCCCPDRFLDAGDGFEDGDWAVPGRALSSFGAVSSRVGKGRLLPAVGPGVPGVGVEFTIGEESAGLVISGGADGSFGTFTAAAAEVARSLGAESLGGAVGPARGFKPPCSSSTRASVRCG